MEESFKNPYLTPQANLKQSSRDEQSGELASIGERVGARCIDFGLWFLVCFGPFIALALLIELTTDNFYAIELDGWLVTEFKDYLASSYHPAFPDVEPNLTPPWILLIKWNLTNPWAYFWLIFGQIGFLILQGYLLGKRGQTIGKRLLDIAIVDRDTLEKPHFGKLFLKRYLVFELLAIIGYWLIFLFRFVDFLMLYRDDRRTVHDIVANTIVVKL